MWMEALGYTAVPGRGAPGADRLDVADADVREAYDGLHDNACTFVVGRRRRPRLSWKSGSARTSRYFPKG